MSVRRDYRDPLREADRFAIEEMNARYYGEDLERDFDPEELLEDRATREGYESELHRDDPNDYDRSDPDDSRFEAEWAADRRRHT